MKLNVQQLAAACLDVAYLERLAANPELAPPRRLTKASDPAASGTLFHDIVHRFLGRLTDPKHSASARSISDADAIWKALHAEADPDLQSLLGEGKVPEAARLIEALRAFAHRLVDIGISATGQPPDWRQLFAGEEFAISNVPLGSGPQRILVSGRLDALRRRRDGGLEIVDYKLSKGGRLQADLIQMAIYARLLKGQGKVVATGAVLEYYEPDLHAIPVAAEELERVFEQLVQPTIDRLLGRPVGTAQHAAALAGPAIRATPTAATARDAAAPLNEVARQIETCFASFKLPTEVLGWQEAPQLVRYRLTPGEGVKVVSLANRAEDLRVKLGCPLTPIIDGAPGFVTVDVPKRKPDSVSWESVRESRELSEHPTPLAFPVGVGVDGKLLLADLADPNTCHALVAGATGSGKSEWLKSAIASLCDRTPPESLQLSLIDPKMVTFSPLNGSPFLSCPVLTSLPDAVACLESAVEEMEHRYAWLARAGLENLSQAAVADRASRPWQVIVFDEFADLILGAKEQRRDFEQLVSRIAGKGRAAGIHLVLATQRPDKTVVTGLIKANLPLKVCLRVATAVNSQIVLDQSGAESLLGRGDLLCHRGLGVERAQGAYIAPDLLRAVMSRRR